MTAIDAPARFGHMNAEHAPGQQQEPLPAGLHPVDFSHGDVAAFPPPAEVVEAVTRALHDGGTYAYSAYRGHPFVREALAPRIAEFTGAPVDPATEMIVTPGTQGGLFLALSSLVEAGDTVAVVAPDYFANRKIVQYLGGRAVPVALHYLTEPDRSARLDLTGLREVFAGGARLLVLSNPNNPTGVVFSAGTSPPSPNWPRSTTRSSSSTSSTRGRSSTTSPTPTCARGPPTGPSRCSVRRRRSPSPAAGSAWPSARPS